MIVIPKSALKAAALAAAPERKQFATDCVRVLEGDRRWRLEATDGKLLAVLAGAMAEGAFLRPSGQGEPRWEYLVEAKGLKAPLADANKKQPACALSCEGDSARLMTAPSTGYDLKLGEGRFPDAGRVITESRTALSVTVDPALLRRLCDIALALPAKDREPHRLTLSLSLKPDAPLAFSVGEQETLECFGLLMPFVS